MRPRLLSFHAVEALLDAAFPQTRHARQLRRKRAPRQSEIEIPTTIRPDLTVSAALSKLNQVLATEPTIREKPPDRSGVVRAVSKKNATWLSWLVRIPAAVALGIVFGTLIAIFLYGEDIVFRDLESTIEAPPRASVEPTPPGPPPPMPVAISPAPEAAPPPVKKVEKVKKPAATPSTSKEKTKDTKVTTPPKAARPEPARPEPPRPEARAPQTPPPVAAKAPPPSSSAQVDDKAMKREKALAEAARKLAEGQLSQSLAR